MTTRFIWHLDCAKALCIHKNIDLRIIRCLPGPLTPGRSFAVQVYVGLTFPHVRADVPVRMTFLPLLPFGFQCFQLLISLRATMMAMITMSTTRMIRRISVRPIPSSPPEVEPLTGEVPER